MLKVIDRKNYNNVIEFINDAYNADIIYAEPYVYRGETIIEVTVNGIEYELRRPKRAPSWGLFWHGFGCISLKNGEFDIIPISQKIKEFRTLREAKKFIESEATKKRIFISREKEFSTPYGSVMLGRELVEIAKTNLGEF